MLPPDPAPRLRVLVACEFSGRVRDAFRSRGHDATSCDLLPTETPGPHVQGDVRDLLTDPWDLIIAHPPCRFLSAAGASLWPSRGPQMADALDFVLTLWNAPAPRVAIENPVGALSSRWRHPSQIIHPWQFGDPFTKRTCLWLRGLDPLTPTHRCAYADGSWMFRFSARRAPHERARTFPGIAGAMADQWGGAPVQLSLLPPETCAPAPARPRPPW